MKTTVAILLGLSLGLVHAVAGATPNFPAAIQQDLGASQAPPCSVCHVCGVTGLGTVNTPFGVAMRARGLHPYDETSLSAALMQMRADKVDTVGDGVLAVDKVRQGLDPNPPGTCNPGQDETIPTYGCVGRIAPSSTNSGTTPLIVFACLGLLVFSRRRRGRGFESPLILAVGITVGGVSACASGAALAPRPDEQKRPSTGKMMGVTSSQMTNELTAVNLDPDNLPAFDDLSAKQMRAIMGSFTRALGGSCKDCHNPADYKVPTRAKVITRHMWNEYVRPNHLANGSVYCDSCHHGERQFLDRRDRNAIEMYMSDNFAGKLVRRDKKDVECETCHGDPADPVIFVKWLKN